MYRWLSSKFSLAHPLWIAWTQTFFFLRSPSHFFPPPHIVHVTLSQVICIVVTAYPYTHVDADSLSTVIVHSRQEYYLHCYYQIYCWVRETEAGWKVSNYFPSIATFRPHLFCCVAEPYYYTAHQLCHTALLCQLCNLTSALHDLLLTNTILILFSDVTPAFLQSHTLYSGIAFLPTQVPLIIKWSHADVQGISIAS